MRLLHPLERLLYLGLGMISRDYLLSRPVMVVGEQYLFSKHRLRKPVKLFWNNPVMQTGQAVLLSDFRLYELLHVLSAKGFIHLLVRTLYRWLPASLAFLFPPVGKLLFNRVQLAPGLSELPGYCLELRYVELLVVGYDHRPFFPEYSCGGAMGAPLVGHRSA